MKTGRIIITSAAALVILALGFIILQQLSSLRTEPPSRKLEMPRRSVAVRTISYGDVFAEVEGSGRLGSLQNIDLIAEVQGQILPAPVPLKKGASFKKGELLVQIFDEESRYNLKASKSSFLNLVVNALPDLKIDFPDSYQKWFGFFESIDINQSLPELPEISDQKEKTFLASRNILNDYYSIKSAEIRFNKHRLYAPFQGSYAEVFLESGSIANPGSRIATLIRTDELELEVPLELSDVEWIRKKDPVEVFDEASQLQWPAEVSRIAGFVDPASQSVSVFVTVHSVAGQQLFDGMYLLAKFKGRKIQKAMSIPRRAVFNNNEVFVVQDSSLMKARIQILKTNRETLLFRGLDEGGLLVVEPLININEGALVIPVNQ